MKQHRQFSGLKSSRNQTCLSVAIAYWLLATIPAQAHPGHSWQETNVTHLLGSPYHLAVLVFVGCGMWLAARFVHRTLPRRLLQGAGITALLAGAALLSIRF
jgi:hypothetical protein